MQPDNTDPWFSAWIGVFAGTFAVSPAFSVTRPAVPMSAVHLVALNLVVGHHHLTSCLRSRADSQTARNMT